MKCFERCSKTVEMVTTQLTLLKTLSGEHVQTESLGAACCLLGEDVRPTEHKTKARERETTRTRSEMKARKREVCSVSVRLFCCIQQVPSSPY